MLFNAFFSKPGRLLRASKSKTKKQRRCWLELQLLKDRSPPAAGSQPLITQPSPALPTRPVDPSGFSPGSGFIKQGFPPAIAALGTKTATAQEWNEVQINQLYS